jgi:hypothetical protein
MEAVRIWRSPDNHVYAENDTGWRFYFTQIALVTDNPVLQRALADTFADCLMRYTKWLHGEPSPEDVSLIGWNFKSDRSTFSRCVGSVRAPEEIPSRGEATSHPDELHAAST